MADRKSSARLRAMLIERNTTHGQYGTPAHVTWRGMIERCTNPKNSHWHLYGGAGVTVCERWRSFENFLADMGPRPDGMSIDRIDNAGNYEPENCRWASAQEQAKNRSISKAVTVDGELLSLQELSARTGIGYPTLRWRIHIKKMPVELALSMPVSNRGGWRNGARLR